MVNCLLNKLERFGPAVLSLVLVGGLLWSGLAMKIPSQPFFVNLLGSIVDFSAILIGFLGVLLGLLTSISGSKTMKRIFSLDKMKRLLKSYFYSSVLSGFFLVILTLLMYFQNKIVVIFGSFIEFSLASVWFYLLSFFILSSFRIIWLMLDVLFEVSKEDTVKTAKGLSASRKKKLRRAFSVKNASE